MRVLLFFLGTSVLCPAAEAQDITERDALQRLSASSPRARALALGVDLARAAARAEGLFPNGSVTYSRENAAGLPETYLWFEQPLALTGRRRHLRGAAEALAEGEEHSARMRLHELRVNLRLAFRDLLLVQEQLEVYGSARARLEDAVDVVRRRERAGESSGYDRIRVERELSMFEAEVRGFEARLEGARGLVASFFPEPDAFPNLRAAGKVRLPGIPDLDRLLDRSAQRGDIRAELQQAESSSLAMEAARRKRLPEPIVSGGLKSPVMDGRREYGYVLSVTVPLPFFDNGRADRARAEAARRAALARAEALSSEVRLRIKGAWEELQRRVRAAEIYEEQVGSLTADLVRIARVAYEGDEIGILELLDAYRTDRETRLQALELRAAATHSALELERLVGEEVIP